MWLKNIQLYQLTPITIETTTFGERLAAKPLTPCGSLERQHIGWLPAHGDAHVYHQGDQLLIAMGIEDKVLPAAVVKQVAEDKIAEIEEAEGYRPGIKRRKEIRDQVEDELLPRAFVKRTKLYAWLDTRRGWLAVDAASPAKAEQLVKLLCETCPDIPLKLPTTVRSPITEMTAWLASGEAPAAFTIDRDSELRHPGEDRATVRYTHHDLGGYDIGEHIAAGKQVTRLGLTHAERVSFVLTERFEIKRLQFLDIIKEQAEQGDDAEALFQSEFALMTGELGQLISAVVEACGGLQDDLVDQASPKVHEGSGKNDPLYDQALEIVVSSRKASISHLQRHLQTGYNRSARLIEAMEESGVVSTMGANGARTVLALTN